MTISDESLLPDEAIDNATKFGFDDYSTLLASIIRDKNLQTPFTIAVHGDWGSGKTSLMKTIAKKIEFPSEELVGVKAIWFSAWEFEKLETPLWTVFLNRVIMDLQEMMPNKELKDKIKAFGKGLMLLSADHLFSRTIGVTTKDMEEIKDKVWEDIKRIDCLREELSQYIDEALKHDPKKRNRIVVFVDDLDRCLPEQCVEIFESMKLFLNCKNCVFIVGANKEQIRKIFEQKFGTKDEAKGLNYVEKFVQLEFDLPPKTPDEVKEFLLEHASHQLQENPKTIELISKFIEPNPRKIKRWLNSVMFLERLFKIKQEKLKIGLTEIDVSLASIWLFLKSFFPDFARLIENDPSILNKAIQVTSGKGSKEDKQKIGDFTIDKRLAEFLSLLKPTYNEKQLADMVYLSKLTPVLDVSTVPKDILKRISEMSDDDLSSQLKLFGEDGSLPLADRIIDNLMSINTCPEYLENQKPFQLLDLVFERLQNDSKKIDLFNKILQFMQKSYYAYDYFLPKLQNYIALPVIQTKVVEKGWLDVFLSMFANSSSYDSAKKTSGVLTNFTDCFVATQIETLISAALSNNQIYDSWGAQENIKKILTAHKDKIPAEKREEIRMTLHFRL